ncbi:hypothetical protein DB88DRAFT_531167 [Papiliotrema laurentii]|uniref:Uncharacterized protein n=1 Tax=Papiliotrema laurentii TaxID=5418 RepID=A0AAD9FNM1_PAPLA|nr:hypothetical protein DB88DRAFT_531167 [Papiliotrema laurentii]
MSRYSSRDSFVADLIASAASRPLSTRFSQNNAWSAALTHDDPEAVSRASHISSLANEYAKRFSSGRSTLINDFATRAGARSGSDQASGFSIRSEKSSDDGLYEGFDQETRHLLAVGAADTAYRDLIRRGDFQGADMLTGYMRSLVGSPPGSAFSRSLDHSASHSDPGSAWESDQRPPSYDSNGREEESLPRYKSRLTSGDTRHTTDSYRAASDSIAPTRSRRDSAVSFSNSDLERSRPDSTEGSAVDSRPSAASGGSFPVSAQTRSTVRDTQSTDSRRAASAPETASVSSESPFSGLPANSSIPVSTLGTDSSGKAVTAPEVVSDASELPRSEVPGDTSRPTSSYRFELPGTTVTRRTDLSYPSGVAELEAEPVSRPSELPDSSHARFELSANSWETPHRPVATRSASAFTSAKRSRLPMRRGRWKRPGDFLSRWAARIRHPLRSEPSSRVASAFSARSSGQNSSRPRSSRRLTDATWSRRQNKSTGYSQTDDEPVSTATPWSTQPKKSAADTWDKKESRSSAPYTRSVPSRYPSLSAGYAPQSQVTGTIDTSARDEQSHTRSVIDSAPADTKGVERNQLKLQLTSLASMINPKTLDKLSQLQKATARSGVSRGDAAVYSRIGRFLPWRRGQGKGKTVDLGTMISGIGSEESWDITRKKLKKSEVDDLLRTLVSLSRTVGKASGRL